jgi:predicted aminopeptidase
MREKKRAALEPLRPWLAALRGFEGQEPSNALIASYATYSDLVPTFERLLADAGSDLEKFYAAAKRLASGRSSPDPSSAPRP